MDKMELIVREAFSTEKASKESPLKSNGTAAPSNGFGSRGFPPEDNTNPLPKPPLLVTEPSSDTANGKDKTKVQQSPNEDTETLKVDMFNTGQNIPSRPTSAAHKWKVVQSVVSAKKAFQNLPPKEEQKVPSRHMYGSKSAIPVLPLPLAITFLVCNCIVPGLGTIISGFTFCCVATTYDCKDRTNISRKLPWLITTNVLVGIG
uniref:Uncharacterized protein n=2 Tax=Ciona intestinalis TaxID=7719 RepID=H2XNS6_CIOIN